ncbi:ABC transporter permease [Mycoplasmopsis cricetuli]|uniref:ABC transporter permease n=1 Tax=Mycoplasmopsis cricetuli TaxID=171283 RepID=UPI00046E60F6|nr:ABC transporter permease [Mycoplasmopsis cricetuli]
MSEFILILISTFAFFSILGIASFSGLFSERVGIVNIAIEAMMIVGAVFYGFLAQSFNISSPWMQIPITFIAAIITGFFALLHGFVTIKLKGDHIISGVALNLVAPAIAFFMLKIFGEGNKFISPVAELAVSTDSSTNLTNIISFKVFILIIIFIITLIILNKTKWGLRLKSIGENPQAADVAGVNVNFYKWQGVFISGFLAGIAGSIFFQLRGVAFTGTTNGLGFLALTVLIMGQWKSIYIILIAFIFSLIYATSSTISSGINSFESIKNYSDYFNILPYVFTIVLLAFTSKNSKAPAAVGLPYDKSKR